MRRHCRGSISRSPRFDQQSRYDITTIAPSDSKIARTIESKWRIEQGIGRLKRFKRIALRYEKTMQNFAAFISLACTFIWAKSVHTA
jgi:transposase